VSPTPLPNLTRLNFADAADAARVHSLAAEAERADGYAPLNEQALLDLSAASRTAWIATDDSASDIALLVLGGGELDLFVHPEYRRRGIATALIDHVLAGPDVVRSVWAHGDHPGGRALADRYHFDATRTLLHMRLVLEDSAGEGHRSQKRHATPEHGISINAFDSSTDPAAWVRLNALVFADHPEQGSLTLTDLAARQREPWFQEADFLIARDDSATLSEAGRMIGYNWLKIEGDEGEIYVIGVHPDAAGRGLGRALMQAGLTRLRARGCRTADLYVEAESQGPVHLYRSLGFTDLTVDVQYRPTIGAQRV